MTKIIHIRIFWDKSLLLCNSGWSQISDPPASASWVLELKACLTIFCFILGLWTQRVKVILLFIDIYVHFINKVLKRLILYVNYIPIYISINQVSNLQHEVSLYCQDWPQIHEFKWSSSIRLLCSIKSK